MKKLSLIVINLTQIENLSIKWTIISSNIDIFTEIFMMIQCIIVTNSKLNSISFQEKDGGSLVHHVRGYGIKHGKYESKNISFLIGSLSLDVLKISIIRHFEHSINLNICTKISQRFNNLLVLRLHVAFIELNNIRELDISVDRSIETPTDINWMNDLSGLVTNGFVSILLKIARRFLGHNQLPAQYTYKLASTTNILKFDKLPDVETKIFGLLNNVAEVSTIRHLFLRPNIIKTIAQIADKGQLPACFFACGILANILISWMNFPTIVAGVDVNEIQRIITSTIKDIGMTCSQEIVVYRSFTPFVELLNCEIPATVWWAIWAIRHVTKLQRDKYIPFITNNRSFWQDNQ
ncbi:hypothetical protein MXB_5471 [Myxobolus squamalis]|nr:hypothetical protein MXB_5471 [Myxobolus squamalis]